MRNMHEQEYTRESVNKEMLKKLRELYEHKAEYEKLGNHRGIAQVTSEINILEQRILNSMNYNELPAPKTPDEIAYDANITWKTADAIQD